MKLIFITSDFPPGKGGISTLSKNLAISLSEKVRDFEVYVLSKNDKNDEQVFDFPILRIKSKGLLSNFFKISKIFWQNKREKIIYHTPNLFPLGFFIVINGFLFGKKCTLNVHGTDFLAKGARKITRFLKRTTLKFADKVIFVSQSTKKEVLKEIILKDEKTEVVYCPMFISEPISRAEREKVRSELSLKENDFVLIRVGNLVYRKGDHLIIKALKNLPQNIKLFIVGDGKERKNLENLTKNLCLENQVYFFGRVPNTKIYYEASDLFIMASFYDKNEGDIEGLGIVILEAEQKGLPVIVARSGGMPEAIDEGQTGLVFAENNVEDLKNKILEIFSNRELQEKFRRNGPDFVKEKFNPEKIASQYLEIYQELLEKNGD